MNRLPLTTQIWLSRLVTNQTVIGGCARYPPGKDLPFRISAWFRNHAHWPVCFWSFNDCWTDGVLYWDNVQISLLFEGPLSDICRKRIWGEASSCGLLVYATSNRLQGFCDLQYARIEWTSHCWPLLSRLMWLFVNLFDTGHDTTLWCTYAFDVRQYLHALVFENRPKWYYYK